MMLRGDSTKTVQIQHSTITNTNPASAAIQNLHPASADQYALFLMDADVNGPITRVASSAITVIDDPGVPTAPCSPSPPPIGGFLFYF